MIKKIIKEKIYQTVNTLYRDLQINTSDIDIVCLLYTSDAADEP